jgi:hypothetical protein
MDPATQEREVTVSGSYSGILLACALISDKLAANRQRKGSGEGEEEGPFEEDAYFGAGGLAAQLGGMRF